MTEPIRKKIVHAQTVILQSDLDKLKVKTGEQNTKDAIAVALDAYLGKPTKPTAV